MGRKKKEIQIYFSMSSRRKERPGNEKKKYNILSGRERKYYDQDDVPKIAWKQLPKSYCVAGTLINGLTYLNPKDAFTVILSSGIQQLICITNHDKTFIYSAKMYQEIKDWY